MSELTSDLRTIKGIGEKKANALKKLGIETVLDLIMWFPRTYEDRRGEKLIAHLMVGDITCVRAMVAGTPRLSHIRQGLDLVKFRIVDETGALNVTYFNQSYLKNSFSAGDEYVFFGTVSGAGRNLQLVNPVAEPVSRAGTVTGRLVPIYRLTAGISQKSLANAVIQGLEYCGGTFPDYLPKNVRERFQLCDAGFAYKNIHFPESEENVEIARRRLIFEELFVLACAMRFLRSRRAKHTGCKMTFGGIESFTASLPFSLTGAQLRAINEAVSDMSGDSPMNRLVQGDVGSGKTVVAAACIWYAVQSGFQSAFMAPTEILAHQHYETLSDMLGGLGLTVGLLTGSMTPRQKKDVYERLASGDIQVLIGTHALITDKVEFNRLGLVITDEQHRFGVNQRSALVEKGDSPHVLVMSATPIPRTLALIIYGDLDVSVIDELPPGREPVDTFVVNEGMRQRIYNFIRRQVQEGRQVYVICPTVENSDGAPDLKSVTEYTENLKKNVFPDLSVALLHGKMKAAEKDAVMSEFSAGNVQVLVATTVVEVGVDVPNASLIVIENADRFGLSQLHQLRGRVGRGRHKSYCVLFNSTGGEVASQRLGVMKKTNDGFKISEEDLRLRGPGDFFGSRQHGLPEMKIADIASDMDVLRGAQEAANAVLKSDPELTSPENQRLRRRIGEVFSGNADIL